MNCSGCGAAVKPVGNRNHLQCEHCGLMHFPDETDEGLTPTDEMSQFQCPICAEVLHCGVLEGQALHHCRRCRGILSPMPTFAMAVASRRAKNGASEAPPQPFDRDELRRTIKCPGCERRMETYPYAGGGNAVVDACERCQLIWLDADEFTVIGDYSPVRAQRSTSVGASMQSEEDLFRSLIG